MSNTVDTNLLQQILVQLAGQAADPKLLTNGPDLPGSWKSLTTWKAADEDPWRVQGLLAYGNVGTETIAVLAIGVPWSTFLAQYIFGFNPLNMTSPPSGVIGNSPQGKENPMIWINYANAYDAIRKKMWASLSFLNNPGVKGAQLYVTGMGMGGPLAQLSAIDLRPELNHKGPEGQDPPQSTQPTLYAFSTANIGNEDYQATFNDNISELGFLANAGTGFLPVDMFPKAPDEAEKYYPVGINIPIPSSVPINYYTPWDVRSAQYYLKQLGGVPPTWPSQPTNIPNPPAGFDQSLAFALGKFCAFAYQQTMQPSSPGFPSIVPYELKDIIEFNGSPLVYILTSITNVAVVFRGSITFEEFIAWEATSNITSPPWGSDVMQQGVVNVYWGRSENTVASQVRAKIANLIPGKKLFVTGHGFGGALANAAASDFTFQSPVIKLDGVYTFGSNYFAGTFFADKFSSKLGSISYQILRPMDKIATALGQGSFMGPVDNIVSLQGQLTEEEETFHSLTGYLNLLDVHRGNIQ